MGTRNFKGAFIMKNIIKRFSAVLCALVTVSASAAMTVSAKIQEDKSPVLPSGMTVNSFKTDIMQYDDGGHTFASAAVGIFQGDDILYERYFGEIDMENDVPSDENAVYEWGSISKLLVWVSVMQLWEQGKIDLEHDVRDYLPDGFFQYLSYDEPITMFNLMNHDAGWQENTHAIMTEDEAEVLPLGEALQANEPAQTHRPGEVVSYSNYGAAVAGYIVECITGQDYCDYVHEHIFEALGMEHTALNPTHSDNEWVHENRPKTKCYSFSMNEVPLGKKLQYISMYPAGSATGTMKDLITFGQALVNDDAPLFEKKETQELMFTGTDFYGSSDIPMNAHGFWCEEHAVRTFGHNGSTGVFQANLVFDTESETGLVVMINEQSANKFFTEAPDLVFGKLTSERLAADTAKKAEIDGYYLPARARTRGMLKIMTYFSSVSGDEIGKAEDIGNDVYIVTAGEGNDAKSNLIGKKQNDIPGVQVMSTDYLRDKFYIPMIALLGGYVLMAIISVNFIRLRLKLSKHKKWQAFSGSTAVIVGCISGILSAALIMVLLTSFYANSGISYGAMAVFGVMQMICGAVCAAVLIKMVISLFTAKDLKQKTVLALSAAGNAIAAMTIVFFELYRFWEI